MLSPSHSIVIANVYLIMIVQVKSHIESHMKPIVVTIFFLYYYILGFTVSVH